MLPFDSRKSLGQIGAGVHYQAICPNSPQAPQSCAFQTFKEWAQGQSVNQGYFQFQAWPASGLGKRKEEGTLTKLSINQPDSPRVSNKHLTEWPSSTSHSSGVREGKFTCDQRLPPSRLQYFKDITLLTADLSSPADEVTRKV